MLLGIDLGTSSVKAVLLEDGEAVASASRGYRVDRPRPRWAESSPDDWWQATVGAVRDVVGGHRDAVLAIGLSGQMHGVVTTDGHGQASRLAILWADQRALPPLAAWHALDESSRRRLANPLVDGMAGPGPGLAAGSRTRHLRRRLLGSAAEGLAASSPDGAGRR